MLTITFIIIAIINALMLLGLLGVIYYRNKSTKEDLRLEKYQDILVLGLFIGIVLCLVLSAVIII